MKYGLLAIPIVLALGFTGCATPDGSTPADQRASALQVRETALNDFYESQPELRQRVKDAAGTVFFSNFALHPGLLTFANGYGIVENNKSGKQTHLRMFRFGIGPGISVKGHYVLAVLDSEAQVAAFEAGRWTSGAFAEASFVFGDFGGAAVGEVLFESDAEAELHTHTGFGLEATLASAWVWAKDSLNEGAAD